MKKSLKRRGSTISGTASLGEAGVKSLSEQLLAIDGSVEPAVLQEIIGKLAINAFTVTGTFRPPVMTAAQASAITPTEGDQVHVTDTDATFLSVGPWSYTGGSWTPMT